MIAPMCTRKSLITFLAWACSARYPWNNWISFPGCQIKVSALLFSHCAGKERMSKGSCYFGVLFNLFSKEEIIHLSISTAGYSYQDVRYGNTPPPPNRSSPSSPWLVRSGHYHCKPFQTCSLEDPQLRVPPPHWYWHLVAEACTVGKRAVRILLKCYLGLKYFCTMANPLEIYNSYPLLWNVWKSCVRWFQTQMKTAGDIRWWWLSRRWVRILCSGSTASPSGCRTCRVSTTSSSTSWT